MHRVIECRGSHFDIGRQHGVAAKARIAAGIANYSTIFQQTVGLSWTQALETAERFVPSLEIAVPHLMEEMRGIADGSGQSLLDILTLNARSEISLTKSSLMDPLDGCTAFSRSCEDSQWLQQNWDWTATQLDQIVVLRIHPAKGPKITTITEAGLVAKVGMNSLGVAVTLNALKTEQLKPSMLPIHIALRIVLESASRNEALARLEELGVASAAHFLIADGEGALGVEVNPVQPFGKIQADDHGNIFHTNHCIAKDLPSELTEVPWLTDSPLRLSRVAQLVSELTETSWDTIHEVFEDEQGLPNAINRNVEPNAANKICTIFTVVMNCTLRALRVTFGRPTEVKDSLEIDCTT